MISLYDTAQKQVVPLKLREDGKVSIYVCGPTVYDAPHLGHGRFVLIYDVLRRYLEWQGLDVLFVSNITDIDDKIIERAQRESIDSAAVAKEWERVWWETMDRLNVKRPDQTPHATEYVDEMIEMVTRLLDNESAYRTSDGVYFSVESVEGYGLLTNQSIDNLLEGGGDRTVVGSEKKHPADFALWKLAKEGEPFWPSPWGDGRPGWHTECVAMSLDILGENFDLHTGGLDLVFPHHENERAQAVALCKGFAQHWMHNGFVEMGGEKMSKSLGNTKNLVDITTEYDPRAYRLLVLQSHYRSPIEVTDNTIFSAAKAVERLDTLARRAASQQGLQGNILESSMKEFASQMDQDFDTPAGTELLFTLARQANTAFDSGDIQQGLDYYRTVEELRSILGLSLVEEDDSVPEEIQKLVESRNSARESKNFELADQLREELENKGWILEDSAAGVQIRRI